MPYWFRSTVFAPVGKPTPIQLPKDSTSRDQEAFLVQV